MKLKAINKGVYKEGIIKDIQKVFFFLSTESPILLFEYLIIQSLGVQYR